MSTSKKYNLSPLPAQRDDYSQYEESVTRWDRIIPILLVVFLVLGVGIYALLGSDESEMTIVSEQDSQTEMPLPDETALQEPAQRTTQDKQDTSVETAQNTTLPPDSAKVDVPTVEETGLTPSTSDEQLMGGQNAEQQQPESEQAAHKSPAKPVSMSAKDKVAVADVSALALITHHHTGITQARLTQDAESLQAENGGFDSASSLSERILLPSTGITKVILLTEMKKLKGTWLYHDWYREGERVARVNIPVSHQHQYSASSKFINTQMTGKWQVKVIDSEGKLYLTGSFEVSAR